MDWSICFGLYRGDKNNTIDVHTPKRKERSITDESFLKFQSRIHEFKDRIAVNELSTTEFVSTPVSTTLLFFWGWEGRGGGGGPYISQK